MRHGFKPIYTEVNSNFNNRSFSLFPIHKTYYFSLQFFLSHSSCLARCLNEFIRLETMLLHTHKSIMAMVMLSLITENKTRRKFDKTLIYLIYARFVCVCKATSPTRNTSIDAAGEMALCWVARAYTQTYRAKIIECSGKKVRNTKT